MNQVVQNGESSPSSEFQLDNHSWGFADLGIRDEVLEKAFFSSSVKRREQFAFDLIEGLDILQKLIGDSAAAEKVNADPRLALRLNQLRLMIDPYDIPSLLSEIHENLGCVVNMIVLADDAQFEQLLSQLQDKQSGSNPYKHIRQGIRNWIDLLSSDPVQRQISEIVNIFNSDTAQVSHDQWAELGKMLAQLTAEDLRKDDTQLRQGYAVYILGFLTYRYPGGFKEDGIINQFPNSISKEGLKCAFLMLKANSQIETVQVGLYSKVICSDKVSSKFERLGR